jgi:uncharacterized membrane protein
MKINFHKYPAVDFLVRLLLTIIIISCAVFLMGCRQRDVR